MESADMRYPLTLNAFYSAVWAILPGKLAEMQP